MANPFLAAAAEISVGVSKKETDLTWDGDRGWQVLRGVRKDLPYTYEQLVYETFRKNGVVSACVRTIVSAMAEAPIRAFLPGSTPETWNRQVGHRAELLMEDPNGADDSYSFLDKTVQHFFFGGNAYWKKVRQGSRRVVRLLSIRPDRVVGVGVDEEGTPLYWKITNSLGQVDRIRADDIVHFPDVDPLNEVFGVPRLLAATLDTHSDNQASEYVSEILSNHGSPGLIIGVDKDTKNSRITEAEDRWEEKYGPGRGRGKVGFIPGAQTVKEIGFSLNQLEFPNLRAISRETICAVFGVDPLLIGIGSAARAGSLNGTEAVAALRRLWTQTLIPMIRRLEARMNKSLSPEFGEILLFFETTQIEALQEPKGEAVKRALDMKKVGGYSIPELRAETGHEPKIADNAVVLQDKGTVAVPAAYLNDATQLEEERQEDRDRAQQFADAEGAASTEAVGTTNRDSTAAADVPEIKEVMRDAQVITVPQLESIIDRVTKQQSVVNVAIPAHIPAPIRTVSFETDSDGRILGATIEETAATGET